MKKYGEIHIILFKNWKYVFKTGMIRYLIVTRFVWPLTDIFKPQLDFFDELLL